MIQHALLFLIILHEGTKKGFSELLQKVAEMIEISALKNKGIILRTSGNVTFTVIDYNKK